jgi:hypothetical protein
MLKLNRSSISIILEVSLLILLSFGQSDSNIINTHTIPGSPTTLEKQFTECNNELPIKSPKIDILRVANDDPFELTKLTYPGYDTLFWHDYSPSSGGYTIKGYQAGFGVLLTPEYYPAVIAGVHHRVFRLNSDSMQIRFVDDDGPGGAPLSSLYKMDTVTTSYSTSFIYHAIPPPKCTIWEGKFYVFMLGNAHNNTIYLLNWLRDPTLNAPAGYHWRHDTTGTYTSWNPGGDLEMGVVVEYHDVSIDSLHGIPSNDTVFIDSTYSIDIFCQELAGFSEYDVPVIFNVAGVYSDTGYLSFTPNGIDSTTINWTVDLPEGTYSCTCYIALSSDTRDNNDTLLFDITAAIPVAIAGEEKIEREFKLEITPNPAVNLAKVNYTLPVAGPVLIELYNVIGNSVKSHEIGNPTKEGVFLVKELSAGVYILRFNSRDIKVTRKIVLER